MKKNSTNYLYSLALSVFLMPIFSGISHAQSNVNYALLFDGIGDELIFPCRVPQSTQITVECSFKTVSPGTGKMQALISSILSTGFVHLQLSTDPNSSIVGFQNIGWSNFPNISPAPYDTWRHIALSLRPGLQKLYVDGILIATRTDPYSHTTGTADLKIGNGFASSRFFKGYLDEVRIWTVARTQQEIVSTMHREIPGDTASLFAYYRMDTIGEFGLIRDFTPNNYHAFPKGCETGQRGPQLVISDQIDFIPLPVEFLEFTGQPDDRDILLHWTTATETNNDGFIVQRLREPSTWEDLGFVKGVGNSSRSQSYTFLDTTAFNGRNFYQLKQMDHNGETATSKTIQVALEANPKASNLLRVYPNPAGNLLNIVIEAASLLDEQTTITMTNMAGTPVTSSYPTGPTTQFEISGLTKGIYVILVKFANGTTLQTKFQKL